MKLSRRRLLQGVSVIALMASLPRAEAILHRSASSNGGVTQMNTLSAQSGGQYMFINFMKGAQQLAYNTAPTDTTAPGNPILELDANGYPTSIPAGVTNGFGTIVTLPNANRYSGTWVLKWDGTGTAVPANFSFTSGTITSNRYEFTNNNVAANGTPAGIWITATSAAPNNLKNLVLCKITDEAALTAGAVFNPDHVALMRSANPGCIRSLGWGGGFNGTNDASIGLWAQRRPVSYITWQGDGFFNPNWWGGTTTNSGYDFTLAYGGYSLTDKSVVQLRFNVTVANNSTGNDFTWGRASLAWSTTNTVAINVAWTAHGFQVGNAVMFGDNPADSNAPPAALSSGVMYFVNNVVDANNFTVSATSGGSSVVATATTSGTMWAIAIHRINVNSTGFVPMTNFAYPAPDNCGYSTTGPTVGTSTNNVSTLVYDATVGWFTLKGPGSGMINGGPPEVFIDYCNVLGANPWLTAPYLTLTKSGGVTDYMTSWVTYAKNTYPWMKPYVEPYNETWNGNATGFGTFYATFLAQTLWGTPGTFFPDRVNQSYGKWVSDLGQAISAIYGNDRTKYAMICAAQAVPFNGGSGTANDNRLKSAAYVTAGGSAAYLWADRVCIANYYSPLERFTVQEMIDAFNYSVTDAGNSTAQAVIANSYASSADTGSNSPFNLTWNLTNFTAMKSWAQGMPGGNTIKGMVSYEGGWSPDYLKGNWTTSITAATQANPCVLTLGNTNSSEFAGMTGNPAVIGMSVTPSGVGGMTQLNGNTYTVNGVGVASGLSANQISINVDSTAFSAYTSGGTGTWVNSETYSNTLRQKAGDTTTNGTLNTKWYGLYAGLASAGFVAEYPSNFIYFGTGSVWLVLQPDIYAPLTPQWNSIVAAN